MEVLVLAVVVGIGVWLKRRYSEPVAAPAEVGTVGWAAAMRWTTVGPLARADAWRLLRHPSFLVGILLTPLMIVAAIGSGSDTSWLRASTSIALALVPLGWATIIAANLVALRPRRTGADELLSAAPSPQPVRSVALMLSAIPAATVAAVLAAGTMVFVGRSHHFSGSFLAAEAAAGLLIVAGSVVVGVGVARWLPHLGFGILAAAATMVIQARFFELAAWPWYRSQADPLRFLAFLAEPTSVDLPVLEVRYAAWHLAYLAGLALVMAGVAVARNGVPRLLGALLGATVVVTAATGWAQLRPPGEEQMAEMISYLTDPVSLQTCRQDATVRYCAPPEEAGRVADWRNRVSAVLALLPPPVAARTLRVTYRPPTVIGDGDCSPQPFFDGLHPAVADKVAAADVWPDDGAVHPGTPRFPCGGPLTQEFFTAVQVGAWAVDLPPSPHHLDVRCSATGQARAVAALWLGAAATPDGARTLRALVAEPSDVPGLLTFAGWNDPPMWGVRFAAADAELALRLLEMPKDQVAEALARAWDEVVAPATTSAELARLVAVAPPVAGAPGRRTGAGPACP